MENMKRFVTILGILLTVTILISGSAVAVWNHVTWILEEDTTNIDNINGAPDGSDATIGVNSTLPLIPPELGWVHLDLGSGNEMGPNQNFTVFANSTVQEEYDVWVSEDSETVDWEDCCGRGVDTGDEEFWTPLELGKEWRYIYIEGVTGDDINRDPAYGPEIDAVGWWEP